MWTPRQWHSDGGLPWDHHHSIHHVAWGMKADKCPIFVSSQVVVSSCQWAVHYYWSTLHPAEIWNGSLLPWASSQQSITTRQWRFEMNISLLLGGWLAKVDELQLPEVVLWCLLPTLCPITQKQPVVQKQSCQVKARVVLLRGFRITCTIWSISREARAYPHSQPGITAQYNCSLNCVTRKKSHRIMHLFYGRKIYFILLPTEKKASYIGWRVFFKEEKTHFKVFPAEKLFMGRFGWIIFANLLNLPDPSNWPRKQRPFGLTAKAINFMHYTGRHLQLFNPAKTGWRQIGKFTVVGVRSKLCYAKSVPELRWNVFYRRREKYYILAPK